MKISENNFRNMEYQSWNPPRDDLVRGIAIKDNNKEKGREYTCFLHKILSQLHYWLM